MHLFVYISKLFGQMIHQIICIHLAEHLVNSSVRHAILAPPCERIAYEVANQKPRRTLASKAGRIQIKAHSEQKVF